MRYKILVGILVIGIILLSGCVEENCDVLEGNIRQKIDDLNYCEVDSDCTSTSFGCPFGCGTFVNKDADLTEVRSLVKLYDQNCPMCLYDCMPFQPVCRDDKCVPKQLEQVTITTDKTEYEQGETVKFIVKNNLDQKIVLIARDLMIEKLEDNEWKMVRVLGECCGKCRPVFSFDILPNSAENFTWDQKTFACEILGEVAEQMSEGRYRSKGNYYFEGESGDRETIYSNEFTIKKTACTQDAASEFLYTGQGSDPCDRSCESDDDCKFECGCECISKNEECMYTGIVCEAPDSNYGCKCVDPACRYEYVGLKNVTISTDKTEYVQGEVVEITITNNQNTDICYFTYRGSQCYRTPYSVYQFFDEEWKFIRTGLEIEGCPQVELSPVCEQMIKPNDSVKFRWDQKIFFKGQAPPGRYKLSIDIGVPGVIYSNEFTIKEGEVVVGCETHDDCEYLECSMSRNIPVPACINGTCECVCDYWLETGEPCL